MATKTAREHPISTCVPEAGAGFRARRAASRPIYRATPWHARRGLRALCAAVIVGSVAAGVLSLRPPRWCARPSSMAGITSARCVVSSSRPGLPGIWTGCRSEAAWLYPARTALRHRRQSPYHLTTFFEKAASLPCAALRVAQRMADGLGAEWANESATGRWCVLKAVRWC